MRSIGYSFNNAIADIVDNSIAAGATEIDIKCDWGGDHPTLEIKDNLAICKKLFHFSRIYNFNIYR